MKIEEHNARHHRGLPDDDSDVVVSHGAGTINLSEAEAYQLSYELLKYLGES